MSSGKGKPARKSGSFFKRKEPEDVGALQTLLAEERANVARLIEERAVTNEQHEASVDQLEGTFKRIQKSLSRMDKERKRFKSSSERSAKENQHLRKIIRIRDRELQKLNLENAKEGESQRNSSESSSSSSVQLDGESVNMNLNESQVTKMMTNLELQLSLRDEHVDNLLDEVKNLKDEASGRVELEAKLRSKEGEEAFLKTQMSRMEADYELVLQSLGDCFEKMKMMTKTYRQKEAERTEIIWEANRCLLEQKQVHLQTCSKMAKELFRLNGHIKNLESTAGEETSEDTKKKQDLETLVLDNARTNALVFKEIEHEKELENLRQQKEEAVNSLQEENQSKLEELNQQLSDAERHVAKLRIENKDLVSEIQKTDTH